MQFLAKSPFCPFRVEGNKSKKNTREIVWAKGGDQKSHEALDGLHHMTQNPGRMVQARLGLEASLDESSCVTPYICENPYPT
jgi:hypothetical protein